MVFRNEETHLSKQMLITLVAELATCPVAKSYRSPHPRSGTFPASPYAFEQRSAEYKAHLSGDSARRSPPTQSIFVDVISLSPNCAPRARLLSVFWREGKKRGESIMYPRLCDHAIYHATRPVSCTCARVSELSRACFCYWAP